MLASILAPLWHPLASNSMFWGNRFWDEFIDDTLINLGAKCGPGVIPECSFFLHFFDPVPQGVFLKVPWLTLALFWLSLGSMLVVLGIYTYIYIYIYIYIY